VRKIALLLATALLLPIAGQAATKKLTLHEATTRALENNYRLKSGKLMREAAKSDIAISKSRYFPRISLEESFTAANAPSRVFMMKLDQGRIGAADFTPAAMNDPASSTDFTTAITLEQPLFDLGITQGMSIAKEADAAEEWRLTRLREETAFQVFTAYVQVERASLHQEVASRAVASAREQERLAQVRSNAGVGLKSDELRARTFVSEMEQQSIAALNSLELAKLELGRLLGEPPGTAIDIAEQIVPRPLPDTGLPLIEQAMANRQDLLALERQVAQSAVGMARARGAYLPTIYGTAGYQMHDRTQPFGRDNDGWVAGASLRWELFDGMRRSSTAEQASLQNQALQAQLDDYRHAVALQVTESILRREEAGKRLEVARHAVLAAEEGAQLVQKRYENSISLFIELLDAQINLNQSRARLVDQETASALAGAQVYHAVGTFLKETQP
jgi:outer membrane protein TolC